MPNLCKKLAVILTKNGRKIVEAKFAWASPIWREGMSFDQELESNQEVVEFPEGFIPYLWFLTMFRDGYRIIISARNKKVAFLTKEAADIWLGEIRKNTPDETLRLIYGGNRNTLRMDPVPCYSHGDPNFYGEERENSKQFFSFHNGEPGCFVRSLFGTELQGIPLLTVMKELDRSKRRV